MLDGVDILQAAGVDIICVAPIAADDARRVSVLVAKLALAPTFRRPRAIVARRYGPRIGGVVAGCRWWPADPCSCSPLTNRAHDPGAASVRWSSGFLLVRRVPRHRRRHARVVGHRRRLPRRGRDHGSDPGGHPRGVYARAAGCRGSTRRDGRPPVTRGRGWLAAARAASAWALSAARRGVRTRGRRLEAVVEGGELLRVVPVARAISSSRTRRSSAAAGRGGRCR